MALEDSAAAEEVPLALLLLSEMADLEEPVVTGTMVGLEASVVEAEVVKEVMVPVEDVVPPVDVVDDWLALRVDALDVFMAHSESPVQVYPKGQHLSPHLGRESSSRVVLTEFLGCAVAFWSCTSQVMVSM